MSGTGDRAGWLQAVQRFSCPFCGAAPGRPCVPAGNDPFGYLAQLRRTLVKPHVNRLRLLEDS
jgi:hypothetical protein